MQLKIALWNANGLAQHTEEVKNYIQNQQVDIMLVVKGPGLAHIIKKYRLSTRFFASIFRVVAAYSLVM